jgi:hypothetical protein
LVKSEKPGQAESCLSQSMTVRSLVYCAFRGITAACAHFSWGALTVRLVERQLVIRPPRKNQECERETQDTVKGKQSLAFRNPGLRDTFQFNPCKSVAPRLLLRFPDFCIGCLRSLW